MATPSAVAAFGQESATCMTVPAKRKFEFSIQGVLDQAHRFLEQGQWDVDVAGLSTVRGIGIRVIRIFSLAWQGMVQNDCLTRASALTYITVLSLVPLLAFAFSMAKGFGAYERLVEATITPFLDQLAPPASELAQTAAPEGAQQIRGVVENVLSFVGNTSFANLGLLGLIFLIFAALRLMTTVEGVFNMIWGVRQARPVIRQVTDFVALIVVTPILLLVATTVTVSLQSNVITEFLSTSLGLGAVVQLVTRLVPLMVVWLGFALLYMIMPNTRVPFGSALIGGLVGGTIWQIVQVLHIQFQIGVANYNAIYAGFAALPLFLVWVYMNWVAVLLGGLVAWAHQTQPAYRDQRRSRITSLADREVLALKAAVYIARSFADGRGAAATGDLAGHCGIAPGVLQDVLEPLVKAGLIARAGDGLTQGFLPARAPAETKVDSVLRALRGERQDQFDDEDPSTQALDRLRDAVESSPDNVTLLDLMGGRAGQSA